MNRRLMSRFMKRDERMGRRMDERNPYGSRGGYVTSHRDNRDRGGYYDIRGEYDSKYDNRDYARSSRRDRGYSMSDEHYGEHTPYYEMYGIGAMYPHDYEDYGRRTYHSDYRGMDYGEEEMEKEYHEDLQEWIDKMKSKDRFKLSKEQITQQAKNMGVRFDKFNELEFYAIYLAMVTDYKSINGDYNMYLRMTKDFFEDDDIEVSPSEKVYIYLYNIVKGEE